MMLKTMNNRACKTLVLRLSRLRFFMQRFFMQRFSSICSMRITPQVKSAIGHQHCYLCHQYCTAIVCHYCFDRLREAGFGKHRSSTSDLLRNPFVLKNLDTPNYDHLYAIDNYVWPIDKLVLDMKFSRKSVAAEALASLFMHFVYPASTGRASIKTPPQLLVPVPLSNKRYWQRQYNQAQLLCDCLSKTTFIPNKAIVQRVKHTQAQAELDKQQRIKNVSNAFRCDSAISEKHVALIDDVITTGVTVNAVCNALKKRNPDIKITVWTMAVTLLK